MFWVESGFGGMDYCSAAGGLDVVGFLVVFGRERERVVRVTI